MKSPPTSTPTMDFLEDPSTNWEWGNLLDFSLDENISWSPQTQPHPSSSELDRGSDGSDKRDPRLSCENFLAGRIPCSCPELDNEVDVGVSKKRARSAVVVRCQVPGCEVDISELKGYHKRHRVCLRCANAASVVLGGESKRYCQQCGKFHILPDFDEGKRSCRRKLERHNKRRRRKSTDSRDVGEKETQVDHSIEDIPCDGETGKDNLCVSTNIIEETCLDYEDGPVSPFCLLPPSQNIGSISVNKVTSSIASGDTQMEGQNNSKCITSLFCDDKSAYSSACPTGRISFKLYDWNPAEFPRRLRHQIFQWLSSMPVELEGYIRPGCTILTIFISMPQLMWGKLSEDAVPYIHNLINAPESMLFERGSMVVNVNNMIYRVLKGGSCLTNVKMGVTAPRLHYVYPNYFEAGKPVEFIACGNNLLQPKFRFLVSFAGKYLAYDHCVSVYHGKTGSCYTDKEDTVQSCAHQLYKIYIPKTEPKLFGPAFVEAWKSLKSSKASFKTVADVGEPSIKARKGHQQNRGG